MDGVVCRLTVVRGAFCKFGSLKMCYSKVVLYKFVCSLNSFEVYVRQRTVSK